MGTDSESICCPDPRIGGTIVGDDAEPQPSLVPADRAGVWDIASGDRQPCPRFHEAQWERQGWWRGECHSSQQVRVVTLISSKYQHGS